MSKRWDERILDLKNAISRLEEAIEDSKKIELSTLKDGVIQRFEFSIELSWKILKIYLNEEGIENIATPKSTIRESFKVGIVKNVDTWLEMIDDRNLTSHIYNQSLADDIYTRIATKYIKELKLNLEYMSRVEL